MPVESGPIYRANREVDEATSVFYRELMATMESINAVRIAQGEQPLGYRRIVTEGLGLADSFTGKIKNGKYVPTREKLESLAAYLGVRPESWDTYVRRYATTKLEHPEIIEFFRLLASLPSECEDIILGGAVKWAQSTLDKAEKKSHPVAA